MGKSELAEEILADFIEINSLALLFWVAEDLRSLIARGLLRQVSGEVSIQDIVQSKPLPAVIGIEFETVPGKTKYRLGCETDPGGGSFKRVKD